MCISHSFAFSSVLPENTEGPVGFGLSAFFFSVISFSDNVGLGGGDHFLLLDHLQQLVQGQGCPVSVE